MPRPLSALPRLTVLSFCVWMMACAAEPDPNMQAILAGLHAAAQANPMAYYHLNTERAEVLKGVMEATQGPEQYGARFDYAAELLYAGQTQAAIDALNRLLYDLRDQVRTMRPENKVVFDLLAVAYLRLGEQQNCIDQHAAGSCLLPLRSDGVHTRPEGSRKAAEILSKILALFPDDAQARWLLNLAYITLGEYPDGVPATWLIPSLDAGENDTPTTDMLPRFENIAPAVGLDAVGRSGGLNAEDFNGDGHLDLLMTSYGMADPIRLFLADGQGGYTDRSDQPGLAGLGGGLNTIHADYDNDGDADVFVLRGAWLGDQGQHPNSLLQNQGDGTFLDVTFQAGLASYHPTQTAAWGDFNNDGWLDLFVGNESNLELNGLNGQPTDALTPHPSELFLNRGDGTFEEVAGPLGLQVNAYVKGTAWGDVNNDGWLDLFVAVMGGPNRLFLNRGGTHMGDWRFEEVAARAGVQAPHYAFPAWFWDYNHDGWLDLFVSAYDMRYYDRMPDPVAREYLGLPTDAERPRLYRNNGDETFTDVTAQQGLDRVLFAMGANYGDLDNDGWLDLYGGTGAPDLGSLIPNRMFRNQEGRGFDEITLTGGFGHLQKGHAIAFTDLDRDGDQDLYAVMGGALEGDTFQNVLFENPGNASNAAWVTLHLEGRTANRSAIGARVRLVTTHARGETRMWHHVVGTGGSFGAGSLQLEAGLGDAVRLDTVEVIWPTRERLQSLYAHVDLRRVVRIVEGEEAVTYLPHAPIPFQKTGSSPPHEGH